MKAPRCAGLDVQLQQQNDGQEILVWLAERGTKTRHGKGQGHQRAFQPEPYATNTERCPVSFYKKFRSHRPVEMNAPESPFYLADRHNQRSNGEVWYMKAPLGENKIGKLKFYLLQRRMLAFSKKEKK